VGWDDGGRSREVHEGTGDKQKTSNGDLVLRKTLSSKLCFIQNIDFKYIKKIHWGEGGEKYEKKIVSTQP